MSQRSESRLVGVRDFSFRHGDGFSQFLDNFQFLNCYFDFLKINVIFPKLLEYFIQNDGSVVCKWCGEVLPSRTRWYRHKYKLHVSTQVAQPAPLFKCHSCNAYFKSRKGYIGHLSSRHSDNENDENREEPGNKKPRKTSDVSIKKEYIFVLYIEYKFYMCDV